jgi:glutathionyl-hydroquinone reductase
MTISLILTQKIKGWRFATPEDTDAPGENVTPDPLGHKFLRDIYFKVDPEYKGRFTVPTLYDKKQGKIVSNESSEIIRMFYTEVRHTKSYKVSIAKTLLVV